jgi:adenylate cyclase
VAKRLWRQVGAAQKSKAHLPARVAALVQAQQDASEVLVGWVQLGVVLTFAGLYAVSPKTFAAEFTFAPVPWALGIYLAFTLVRVGLARRGRLPTWLPYLSVVVDVLLLYGLIWSFHLQYGQPAPFYLKVPTMLYIFIFIVLRTLQFQVRYVAFAGLTAAIGWLLLVFYAVAPEHGGIITRNYILYLTSNTVLLGAEFDKVISMLVVTAVLAVAIARNRDLLRRSVVEASAARDLSRFVPAEVASQVSTAEAQVDVGQGEERQATIMFADIEGFTSISETLTPRELIDLLNEYFAVVSGPIERHGGVLSAYIGDAILATFNLPRSRAEHAADAVRAALDIQALLEQHRFAGGLGLRARIGLNTGLVVGGIVGTANRLAYTVYGDEVNLAARLEPLNKQFGTYVLVSEQTRDAAGAESFAFRRLTEIMVRGRRKPTVVYALEHGTIRRHATAPVVPARAGTQ